MRNLIWAALLGSTALLPSVGMAQTANQPAAANQNDCDRLVSTLEQRRGTAATQPPVTLDQARTFQRDNNQQACRDALQRLNTAAAPQGQPTAQQNQPGQQGQESGRVVVQQPAPAVRVEQAAPQVTVQQPQPQVSVRQPQPEITVRMPPPTITVQQPQPEITVRMPNPEVNVTMPQPQVAVNQPQPQVQVEQPKQQPQVQVQREQPQVQLQPGQQANVNVERAQQPQVHFEQTGQPNVQYNMTGQPKINYEQAQPGDTQPQAQATPDQQRGAADQQAAANQQAARQDATGATPPAAAAQGQRQPMAASQIDKMKLYNERGNQLGDVERVILGNDNKPYIVIGHGGFLKLGEKRVAIPLDDAVVQGNRLVTHGLTDDQIKAMPSWDSKAGNYRELKGDQTAEVTVAR